MFFNNSKTISYTQKDENITTQFIIVIFFSLLTICLCCKNYENAVKSLENDKEELRRDKLKRIQV